MTAIDTKLWNLMDLIRSQGFTPEEHDATQYAEEWFVRPVQGGTQNVRIVVYPNDGHRAEIHYLDRHYVAEWSAAFAGGTPHSVIRATIRAAVNA
jgi:hypothetical protein